MEKLTRENIYINLQGKSKEELTELYNFLESAGEKQYRETLNDFLDNYKYYETYRFNRTWTLGWYVNSKDKQEVTIQQLKEILQPMEGFTPIAMKCTKKQFDAIKPKLKGVNLDNIQDFQPELILVNNHSDINNNLGLVYEYLKDNNNRKVYEEWNEEIFLKACGIEVDTLEQQLEKAEAEVKRLKEAIEEESKPKEITINVSKFDIEHLIKIRNYFGENDKTTFEHASYDVINRIIKQINKQTKRIN